CQIDLSGNTIGALQTLVSKHVATDDSPNLLFSYRYSQFAKVALDLRYYKVFDKDNRIATRLVTGAGFSYGNSNSLPYIKQFFSGGSTSLRGFLPRTVGPGSYQVPDSVFTRVFLDKAGDIKLEANIEYRFTIV